MERNAFRCAKNVEVQFLESKNYDGHLIVAAKWPL